ncbi:MAG: permease [bacterium]
MAELTNRRIVGLQKTSARLSSVWTLIVLIPALVALVDRVQVVPIVRLAIEAFSGTILYILIAVLLIAFLKASSAESLVARAFAGKETRMIFLAALFGGLAPFCSCEVIPFIAGLLAVGAPLSAVMAFWLSSPLIDPAGLMITAGALGWKFAIGKTIAAVTLGLVGGFAIQFINRRGAFLHPLKDRGINNGCGCGPSPFEGELTWRIWNYSDRRTLFWQQAIENALFLVKWLAFAYLLEALLITYVPAEAIGRIVGGEGLWPIIVGALVGAPAYLNSYAAPPLVAGLMQQGMTAGAAMAFMVAGAVSSIPAMAAVWSLVKLRVFFAYVGFGIIGAIAIGVLYQGFV